MKNEISKLLDETDKLITKASSTVSSMSIAADEQKWDEALEHLNRLDSTIAEIRPKLMALYGLLFNAPKKMEKRR